MLGACVRQRDATIDAAVDESRLHINSFVSKTLHEEGRTMLCRARTFHRRSAMDASAKSCLTVIACSPRSALCLNWSTGSLT